jgi:aspartate racemase
LLLQQEHSDLPLLDSTQLHALAAVDFILEGEA